MLLSFIGFIRPNLPLTVLLSVTNYYSDTFPPIAKMNYVQLILSLVSLSEWEILQMDVKITFLHGDLSDEKNMAHPSSFMPYSSLVCRLKKSLYGLK